MEHNPLIVLFTIVGADLFPVLIWGIFAYKYFLAGSVKSAARRNIRPGGYKTSEMKIS
jgi:hypothetical protein